MINATVAAGFRHYLTGNPVITFKVVTTSLNFSMEAIETWNCSSTTTML